MAHTFLSCVWLQAPLPPSLPEVLPCIDPLGPSGVSVYSLCQAIHFVTTLITRAFLIRMARAVGGLRALCPAFDTGEQVIDALLQAAELVLHCGSRLLAPVPTGSEISELCLDATGGGISEVSTASGCETLHSPCRRRSQRHTQLGRSHLVRSLNAWAGRANESVAKRDGGGREQRLVSFSPARNRDCPPARWVSEQHCP